jgi:hypothetical protein
MFVNASSAAWTCASVASSSMEAVVCPDQVIVKLVSPEPPSVRVWTSSVESPV